MTSTISNYEKLCQEWQVKFLTMDQEALLKKVSDLKREGDYLTLSYFGFQYGIHTATGAIVPLSDDAPMDASVRLNLYGLCWYCREDARFLDDWVPFAQLKNASPFGPAFQKGTLKPFAMTFSGHTKELSDAFEALGGKKLPHSDVGYELPSFSCIPVRFLFWDGDEEFPAQANILFDRSAVDFIHVESTVSIACDGFLLLARQAGLSVKGKTFSMM